MKPFLHGCEQVGSLSKIVFKSIGRSSQKGQKEALVVRGGYSEAWSRFLDKLQLVLNEILETGSGRSRSSKLTHPIFPVSDKIEATSLTGLVF